MDLFFTFSFLFPFCSKGVLDYIMLLFYYICYIYIIYVLHYVVHIIMFPFVHNSCSVYYGKGEDFGVNSVVLHLKFRI